MTDHPYLQSKIKGSDLKERDSCEKCGLTERAHGEPEVELLNEAPLPFKETYRAVLMNVPGLERVLQIHGADLHNVSVWANTIKKLYPGGRIDIFIQEERLIKQL